MAHVMLPLSTQARSSTNVAKFADTATIKLLEDMIRLGAGKERLVAKIAGGAQMFSFSQTSEIMNIGYRNSVATKEMLNELRIPLVAEDVGGNFGRTIELYSEDGRLIIKTVGAGVRVL
jgi:chemotaxis protein CheD